MAVAFPPSTMRAWQYSSHNGSLDQIMAINDAAPLPQPKPNQHLVQVIAAALNPVDYKPAEVALISRLAIPKPATPGIDFSGRIVTPAAGSSLERGQLVFGVASAATLLAGGALAEFAIAKEEGVAAIPDGVSPIDAASLGVAGMTAYQTIVPNVQKGSKVFINGGSGGTGVFGIQFAKAVGCHVTTSCSTGNVELCKSLGADEVVDYKAKSVIEALEASGQKFDVIIDNVGNDIQLYFSCSAYTKPDASYVMVAGSPSLGGLANSFKAKYMPSFLGGGTRKYTTFLPTAKREDFEQMATWVKEGSVKLIIDQKFPFEEAPEAYRKLKTGRARGKIVVDVASKTYEKTWL